MSDVPQARPVATHALAPAAAVPVSAPRSGAPRV